LKKNIFIKLFYTHQFFRAFEIWFENCTKRNSPDRNGYPTGQNA